MSHKPQSLAHDCRILCDAWPTIVECDVVLGLGLEDGILTIAYADDLAILAEAQEES